MPLTNAEKQSRARQRRAEKLARMEVGLMKVQAHLQGKWAVDRAHLIQIVEHALNPGKEMGE